MGASAFLRSVDFRAFEINVKTIASIQKLYQSGHAIWASTIPRAIHSFFNQYDLSGKTVIPFGTHNGYGSGNSYRIIAELCSNAINLDGFAVESIEVENAKNSVEQWLDKLNLSFGN